MNPEIEYPILTYYYMRQDFNASLNPADFSRTLRHAKNFPYSYLGGLLICKGVQERDTKRTFDGLIRVTFDGNDPRYEHHNPDTLAPSKYQALLRTRLAFHKEVKKLAALLNTAPVGFLPDMTVTHQLKKACSKLTILNALTDIFTAAGKHTSKLSSYERGFFTQSPPLPTKAGQ